VTAFLDYRSENLVETARKGGLDGFDLLIDAVGRSEPLNRAIGLLKNGGVVTIYGVDEVGGVTIDPSRAPATFTRADYGYDEGEAHDRVIARMREGKLRPADYLDEQIFNLDGIVEVFERVRQRKIIKAVIRIGKE